MNQASALASRGRVSLLSCVSLALPLLAAEAAAAGVLFSPIIMAPTVETLQARQRELTDAIQAIIDAADERDEDLTDAEIDKIDNHKAEIERLGKQITARQAIEQPQPGTRRRTVEDNGTGQIDNAGTRRLPAQPRADGRTGGFRHLGEFAMCVRARALGDEGAAQRLTNALGMNEGQGEDGGFQVPPEWRDGIMKIVEGEESLLSLTDSSPTSRNAVGHNVDKTTPWGTAGLRFYWEGEGQAASASKQPTTPSMLRLNKLFGRVDVSDELLEDAPQLDAYLRQKAPEVMTSVINLAIVQGNGAGKPLGFMNSPALVTVAKETSQPADTIHHRNLVNMMGRMYAPSFPRAFWFMHQDVWAQLPLISFRDGTSTPVPAYMPPSGINTAPYGTLFGRPIKVLEAMETIGDLGDIALVDLKAYRTLTKAAGMRVESSIHLKFDTDETVFRFIFRLAGAPWWPSTISPRDGSNTRSPFVTLASR